MNDSIRSWLVRSGPARPAAVRRALDLSTSFFQRWVAAHRSELVTHGRARAIRYALRRSIEGVLTPIPIYQVQKDGILEHAMNLHPIEPFGFFVQAISLAFYDGFFATEPTDSFDLPWFLQDLRPEGYLGRAWVASHAIEGYPSDPVRWSGDQVLRFAAQHGTDLPGNFVIGAPMAGRLREVSAPLVAEADRQTAYPRLAASVIATRWPGGSTPGGEQPKFTVRVTADSERSCIVKFSPPMNTAVGRRWADLLAVEHLVHELLPTVQHGLSATWAIPAARSRTLDAGGRRFLEVERFDRHGLYGRSGVVSLAALDSDGIGGELRSWSAITEPLVAQERLAGHVHEFVVWLEAFGHLIANTDMHPGNCALRLDGARLTALAPVYDMLPMHFAPRHGELVDLPYSASVEGDSWPQSAVHASRRLWAWVRRCPQISEGFKERVRPLG